MAFNPGNIYHQEQEQQRPFCRPFFLRIRHIEHKQDPRVRPPERGPDFYWAPPESTSDFTLVERPTPWCIWDPDEFPRDYNLRRLRIATSEENRRRVAYRSCSMFWGPDRHGYLIVPVDCLETELSSNAFPWFRLKFGRTRSPDTSHIALAGYQEAQYHLHLPGPGRWFEQLLPDVCEPPIIGPRNCALAGDLSVLVGLVAFSAEPSQALWAVDQSFRPDPASTMFRPNQLPKTPSGSESNLTVQHLVLCFKSCANPPSCTWCRKPDSWNGCRDWIRSYRCH